MWGRFRDRSASFFIGKERLLTVLVFSLSFSWILSVPFEGQVLYALAERNGVEPHAMIFGAITAHCVGLFFCGFAIRSERAAKRLMLFSEGCCILVSAVFFLRPSWLWGAALISGSVLASASVAAWGFYFKRSTAKNERIKTAADGLIYSNLLMIALNLLAIHVSPRLGLVSSMLVLAAALYFTALLPVSAEAPSVRPASGAARAPTLRPLAFLCLFITVITINSGLMYQVMNPAFAHLEWLTGLYWAVPYIAALYLMRNLPRKTNRPYLLYVAIAMIGLSFVAFMSLDRSAGAYLVVNTLMLGACGIFDLFWWSILGEMLELDGNPARILGWGLSANVLGVLIGGIIGSRIYAEESHQYSPSVLALVVIFIVLMMLPMLNRELTRLLKNHAYLTEFAGEPPGRQDETLERLRADYRLTGREGEIAALLLRGRPYKLIAQELYLSENTVKTHVKNLYAKLQITNKTELITLMTRREDGVSN